MERLFIVVCVFFSALVDIFAESSRHNEAPKSGKSEIPSPPQRRPLKPLYRTHGSIRSPSQSVRPSTVIKNDNQFDDGMAKKRDGGIVAGDLFREEGVERCARACFQGWSVGSLF